MLKKLSGFLRRTPFFLPFRQLIISFIKTPKFLLSYSKFKKLNQHSTEKRFSIEYADLYPFIDDDTNTTQFDPHYLYHLSWAIRKVREISPERHIDFSSHIHFASMLSAYVATEFYDYRPAEVSLSNLKTGKADLLKIPFPDNSLQSVSCMHVIEHIGLGRYGDQLDPDGDLKAVEELKRVIAPGGNLLFVTPTGKARLMFNGHRIYSFSQILKMFDGFELVEKSIVADNWQTGIIIDPDPEMIDQQNYACGMFWFTKRK